MCNYQQHFKQGAEKGSYKMVSNNHICKALLVLYSIARVYCIQLYVENPDNTWHEKSVG